MESWTEYRASQFVACDFCAEFDLAEESTITGEAIYCRECWADLTEAEQEDALNV